VYEIVSDRISETSATGLTKNKGRRTNETRVGLLRTGGKRHRPLGSILSWCRDVVADPPPVLHPSRAPLRGGARRAPMLLEHRWSSATAWMADTPLRGDGPQVGSPPLNPPSDPRPARYVAASRTRRPLARRSLIPDRWSSALVHRATRLGQSRQGTLRAAALTCQRAVQVVGVSRRTQQNGKVD